MRSRVALLPLAAHLLTAQTFQPPAGNLSATRRPGAASILPGGRMITPLGRQAIAGPGAFAIAVSPGGRFVATANAGPFLYSISVVEKDNARWKVEHFVAARPEETDRPDAWRGVAPGLVFHSERELFFSEGNSGRVLRMDVRSGNPKPLIELNQGSFRDSYATALAYDRERQILYVVDQANSRVAVVDSARRRIVATAPVGRLPFAAALSPDRKRLWVTNLGMFQYKAVPAGMPFPAFGFPSAEAMDALGDPNVPESNSVTVIDVENPAQPRVEKVLRTGLPFGEGSRGGSGPAAVTVTATHAYVSNSNNDTVSVIDTAKLELEREIPLRIRGLESFRGLLPVGSAYHEGTGWLFVAAAGINALAVLDTRKGEVAGYLPTAWFPAGVSISDESLHVACAKGYGTGPNGSRGAIEQADFFGEQRRGAMNVFPVPDAAELEALTKAVYTNNGFTPAEKEARAAPSMEHVVVIVKESRAFDEVLGDLEDAVNGKVSGIPVLARFGRYGVVNHREGELQTRLGLRNLNVTPNHHALAQRFCFSDNFYADSEGSYDGHHWLAGVYPNVWTETMVMASYGNQKDFRLDSPAPGRIAFARETAPRPESLSESGTLWDHLERHKIPFRNFGAGIPTSQGLFTDIPISAPLYRNTSPYYPRFNTNIPDQIRASLLIREIDELYAKPGKPLPRLLYIHLPNDRTDRPRPEDGYPFDASFVADNDYALGRIVEYFSASKWWPRMAIFVTESAAAGGRDHIDSHRTVMLAISPWARRNFASHANTSFPGLLKTVFAMLGIPPLNLFDATAAGLAGCFAEEPRDAPFKAILPPQELFDPAVARPPQPKETAR